MMTKKFVEFVGLTAGVYAAYILYSIYQQKLFNTFYLKNDGTIQKFTYASATTFFPAFCCYLVGTIRKEASGQGHTKLPIKEQVILGGLYLVISYSINSALIYISYPTQLVMSNLRLLVIFLVAKFMSRNVKTINTCSNSKIFIGLFVAVGILLFNFENLKKSPEKSNYMWGVLLLLVSLIAQGFLIDSQSFVKNKYIPSSNDLFTCTNKITFLFSIISSAILNEFNPIIDFIRTHDDFATDLVLLCIFGTFGQIFIYELIKRFQPHIYAIMTVLRKIMTVAISIVLYGHHTSHVQILGLLIVFSCLVYEIYSQFRPKKAKQV